ncbi:hypothetical protein [Streptomyces harbinensis]|uniref:Uncharacterized protein n=1 Tax=Streptomyces harbinensis TaxID=1176198 RepID=A0A1I6WCW0_9ACTN|nr:hypothetical protein [Streptomyces harbinensis]SFT23581.1 hypothetical protein SAMN05444716_1197 [Streptomyces harbinensis]
MRQDRMTTTASEHTQPPGVTASLGVIGCPTCHPYEERGWVPDHTGQWARCPEDCTPVTQARNRARQLMARGEIIACQGCVGYMRPGSVQAWTGQAWEWVSCPQGCTPETRAASRAQQQAERARAAQTPPAPRAPASRPSTTRSKTPAAKDAASRAAGRRKVERTLTAAVAVDADDAGQLVADTDAVPAPTGSKLADLMRWISAVGPSIGVNKVHEAGRATDGTVCIGAAALGVVKIAAKLPSTEKGMERAATKLRKAAETAGLEISDVRGAGFKLWRRKGDAGGRRMSVKVLIVPWLGQGDTGTIRMTELVTDLAADETGTPDARTLARRMRRFAADLGIPPGGTTAVTSVHLLEAVRPRTEWTEGPDGRHKRQLRPGALPEGDHTVPVAPGARHPVYLERQRAGELFCDDEDFKWWERPLTEEETARPWAVAVDTCASYLSVTETLLLPLGPLAHTTAPAWSPRTCGLWLCDFTVLETEAELPHPATFSGEAPEGPGWYATPTVAYMVREYGYDPASIQEAYVSSDSVPVLKRWTEHVRSAYKQAYATLGITDGMTDTDFLAAWESLQDTPRDVAREDAISLLQSYKGIYKGGIGKWADSAKHKEDDEWLADVASAWHYRPELRYHVVAAARIATHRRARKTFQLSGRAPFAVNFDQLMYTTEAPTPIELLIKTDKGKPEPGTLRLGSAPGSMKFDAAVPMDALRANWAGTERLHSSRIAAQHTTAGTKKETH